MDSGSDGKESSCTAGSQGQEDPLEKGMTTHSSIFARGIPWTEEPGGLQSMGSQRVGHNWANNTFTLSFLQRQNLVVTFFKLYTQFVGFL